MRKSQTYRCIAMLVVSALSVAAPAMAATGDDETGIPTEIRFALQRDLGVMPGQIPQYIRAERRMPELERNARSALGGSFAGLWLERNQLGEYEPVIAVADEREAVRARALGAQVRVVAHRLAELETTQSRLNAAVRTMRAAGQGLGLDPRIHSWHIDPISNSVIVTTDPGAGGVAAGLVATSGADPRTVRFAESGARPALAQQQTFDIRGGDRYNLATGGWCSIGFTVTLGTENGFVTAGHCGVDNTGVTAATGQQIGYIFDSVFPGSDFAVVHNTNTLGIPRPWVNAYAFGGNLNVRGDVPAVQGAIVCRSGARTGARCGNLEATGVTVNYGEAGIVTGLSSTSACVGTGDSGGSFITPDGQAQGVTSGGVFNSGTTENCTVGTPRSFYQPLRPILANYPGLTLMVAP